ncbi:MAG: rhodanese-like domain-containing protein [Pseudomonadota bacterium]|nr:rhodanese-like domain-containing protein [Pseudomonadota bacterium]
MRRFLLLIVGFWATQATAGASFLVSTEQLAAELTQGQVRLLDAEGAENYARAHLSGAVNLPFMELEDAEENAKTGLPIFPRLAASKLEALGLTRETDVVVYDAGDGRGASALWYILGFLGHDKVRILDGGFRKWLKEGRPVTQDASPVVKATYLAQPRADWAVKTQGLTASPALLVDARSIAEFSGKETGGARQGGHLPGAKSFVWRKLAGELATFRDEAAMRKALTEAGLTPDKEIVTNCNGGLGRSTYLYAALKLLGYEKVKVYPGSWIEWASDPIRPIER